MRWNRTAFLMNVEKLIRDKCNGTTTCFDDRLEANGLVTSWQEGASPTIRQVVRICEQFDCDLTWLLTGKPASSENRYMSALVFIPKYEATLSGGGGSFATSDRIEDYHLFPKDRIRNMGNPMEYCLFAVAGDSMAPEIPDGAMVLVHMIGDRNPEITDGEIFAFGEGDTIKVKRLVRREDGIRVLSTNPAYPPAMAETDSFRLFGPVVWSGMRIPFPHEKETSCETSAPA